MSSSTAKGSTTRGIIRRFVHEIRPYGGWFLCIFLLDLISIPLSLLLPLPLKLAVDHLTGNGSDTRIVGTFWPESWMKLDFAPLAFAAALMLGVYAVQHALGFVSWLLRTYTGEKLILGFRAQMFVHAQRLSLSFLDNKGASDPAYRIQYDAPAVRDLVMNGALPLMNALLTLVGMIYVTAKIDGQIALVAVAIAPVLFLLSRRYSKKLREEWTKVRERDSVAMGVVQEVLSSVRVVKAFGQEDREYGRFVNRSGDYMRGQLRLSVLQASFYVMVGVTVAAASATALFLGARHVRAGYLTVGSLLLLMAYVAKLYEPLSTMTGKLVESQAAVVSLGRSFALLDEAPDVVERPRAKAARNIQGGIELRNVSFRYDLRKPVLEKVSFGIAPGTHVGITGASGAGKSTILTLLTRMYDPTEGAILLDGTDLRDYKIQSLREQFAIVLQDPVLFSTTIAENIAYAKAGATRAEIIAAGKAANAHDFVMDLPGGYDTKVGQRGATLSGGERQRISLARAFLKNAPILLMDEPTSALDTQTEAAVVEATEALMAGRTTFVVAHRTSTLDHCHLILHLENGRISVIADDRDSVYPAIVYSGADSPVIVLEPEMACASGAAGD